MMDTSKTFVQFAHPVSSTLPTPPFVSKQQLELIVLRTPLMETHALLAFLTFIWFLVLVMPSHQLSLTATTFQETPVHCVTQATW